MVRGWMSFLWPPRVEIHLPCMQNPRWLHLSVTSVFSLVYYNLEKYRIGSQIQDSSEPMMIQMFEIFSKFLFGNLVSVLSQLD